MNVFIVHAHPEPKSFNGALTAQARDVLSADGHGVRVSDLYAQGFDPVSDRRNFTSVKDEVYYRQQVEEMHASETDGFSGDIQAEHDHLAWCDTLIFQFPLWWFGLPAILKGWVDRVFALGRIYGSGKWYDRGVFAGKRAMLSLTTGGGPGIYRPDGLNGDLGTILYPINHGVLRFTGFDVLPPFVVWGPARATEKERRAELERYGEYLRNLSSVEPIKYPSLDDFDPQTFRRRRD